MYDYISIRANENFSKKITVEKFVTLIENNLNNLKKESQASFSLILDNFIIIIQGILATSNGSYSFYSDSEFTEINLIEIDIPQGAESIFHTEILNLAINIASLLAWEVHDHETEKVLYPKNT